MPKIERDPDIIDSSEVAAMLGIAQPTVIRYTQRGFIPGVKIGFIYRYSRKKIAKLRPDAIDSPARGMQGEQEQGAALQAG